MNIYALKGHKIKLRIDGFDCGLEVDKTQAKKHLQYDVEYTVEKTSVSGSWSKVILQEIPQLQFNTVHFESITKQELEQDETHPDFIKYRGLSIIQRQLKFIHTSKIAKEMGFKSIYDFNRQITDWCKRDEKSQNEALDEFQKVVLECLNESKKDLDLFIRKYKNQ